MDEYSLAFSVSNLGPKSFQKLINEFGNPKKAWEGSEKSFKKLEIIGLTFKKFETFRKEFKIVNYLKKLEKEEIKFISFFDKRYPKSFRKLENPPIGIFCKGNLSLLKSELKIAVVGARKITSYGKSVTESIVSDLTKSGICIVSGLALGVDGASHRIVLENDGHTIAVLACGVDCCLPSENYSIYSNILKKEGLIISEYPLSQSPNKGTFLARNRLIAALSDGVLVTEAAENSGSLVTAGWGESLGKKVFAVPGPITSRMSEGSLKLLKQGAKLVTEGGDILGDFEKYKKSTSKRNKYIFKNLTDEEIKIVKLLENEGMGIDQLSRVLGLSMTKLPILISSLEIKKVVFSRNGKVTLTG